jgi:hypothetical protein
MKFSRTSPSPDTKRSNDGLEERKPSSQLLNLESVRSLIARVRD